MSQWPYSFQVLEVGRLFVDETYQRPLTSLVRKIEGDFDPALVGTLIVSDRGNGRYALVDGQTRAAAIVHLADRDEAPLGVPCLVYTGLTRADEASLFARLQLERRGIASAHRFRAAIVAGDPEAIEIQKVAKRCGFPIGPAGKGNLSAVAAIEKVYRRGGGELLERTLSILKGAWPDVVPSGDVIRGLGLLLTQNAEIEDGRMGDCLSALPISEVKRRALALSEGMGGSGHAEKYMATAIGGLYRAHRGPVELAA